MWQLICLQLENIGSLRQHFGITLRSFWDRFGIMFGSLWDQSGIILAIFCCHSGVNWAGGGESNFIFYLFWLVFFFRRWPSKQIAEPTAQGVLDNPASPVFVYYSTVFFDNMAPPWGIRWRKCDRRRSLDAPSMFPEASKKRAKKTLIFGCLFGSILAPFCLKIL